MRRLGVLICLLAAACAAPSTAAAQDGLTTNALYKEGPSGRWLVGGDWGFSRLKSGPYQTVQVPYVWNANDNSDASYRGGIGFYRKDFRLPGSRNSTWILRFEGVNYDAQIWLNGHLIGQHSGGYQVFEVEIPRKRLRAMNHLLVRVNSRRGADDFPPYGTSASGDPTGGWWNYSGMTREVYLRKVDKVDLQNVAVTPTVTSPSATKAKVTYAATVQNYSAKKVRVKVRSRLNGTNVNLGSRTLGPRDSVQVERTITVTKPKVWSPSSPYLYNTSFTLQGGGGTQTFHLRTGLRSITVRGGRLRLNGQPVSLRGFGMHEDEPGKGFATDNAYREKQIQLARAAGGSMLRSHYPLHPYFFERADELGMFIWAEVPVYSMKTVELAKGDVRRRAIDQIRTMVTENQNHPSLAVYSIGNELNTNVGPYVGAYIREASAAIRKLDSSRPIGLAINGYPGAGCIADGYEPLNVLGINEYFGWYVGPDGQIADQSLLGPYLDQMRRCYPGKALFVTEYGAEANRYGPREEKGSFEFQQDWITYHTNTFNLRSWLSGALYWGLQEFKVRPRWEGGNPRPNSPLHEKGVVTYDGQLKPGYFTLQQLFGSWKQINIP